MTNQRAVSKICYDQQRSPPLPSLGREKYLRPILPIMCPISDRSRPVSQSPSSWEDGKLSIPFGQEGFQDLIHQANTVPLLKILRHYRVRLDEINRKAICPFNSHKGGRENSPSFYYYPDTNSFYCFGCSKGGKHAHGAKFVAWMDNTTEYSAATKIVEIFSSDVDESVILEDPANFSERLKIMMDFSNNVREFRLNHQNEKADQFIDSVAAVYDAMNVKHDLNNEALASMVEQLKTKIGNYQ